MMDKEYVAELLKQLEELKKKKAHKERKLQKLKGCSSKDLRKERSTRVSNTSVQSNPDNESSLKSSDDTVSIEKSYKRKSTDSVDNLNHKKLPDNPCNNDKEPSKNESCHSLCFESHKRNKDLQNSSSINVKESVITLDEPCINDHDDKRTNVDCHKISNYLNDSVNLEKCKPIDSVVDKLQTNGNSKDCNQFLFDDKLSTSVDKSLVDIKNARIEIVKHSNDKDVDNNKISSFPVVIPNIASHNKELSKEVTENVKQSNVPEYLILASVPDTAKNSTEKNQHEDKLSNNSNKSSSSSKDRNFDILDDSLNSNMSIFLSADLFANECNNKKDKNKDLNDNELCFQINKTDSKLPQLNQSHLSINEDQQNNVDVFNFPKFSTPTEGNTQYEKDDDIPNLIEKSPEIDHSSKRSNSLNKTLKNILPSTSKCDSPLLNFVLEKRLSSVLDAHYESPKKSFSKVKNSCENAKYFDTDCISGHSHKKRKLFAESNCIVSSQPKLEQKNFVSETNSNEKSDIALNKSFGTSVEIDQEIKYDGFDDVSTFDTGSNSSNSLKNVSEPPITFVKYSCDDIPSQVSKTVDSLVNKICDDASNGKLQVAESVKEIEKNEELKMDSEVLVIPETEGLALYFEKDTEEFLETSTLSESMSDFPVKENMLNVSSQSKLESPVVNNIVAAVKSSRSFQNMHREDKIELSTRMDDDISFERTPKKVDKIDLNDDALAFENSLSLDTSFLEDDTQDLGNFKQVPYMNDVNINEKNTTNEIKEDKNSNLKFMCSLSGSTDEPVMNVEIVVFNDVKYVVLQHKTYLCVWRQEKKKQWVKTFNHQTEDMLSLVKISVTMDDDNLVIIILLGNTEEQYCLQFLIFEKDARIIKLMENTHWLEERCAEEFVLLCGLSGLMFAVAQNKEKPEVSIHAFISLKENPKLMTAILGSTETPLCSLCKIDKLPNALMGITKSMLYVWHILEARLVTAVSLHPHIYLPIKECFWATVENGLIYFLTTCEEDKNHHISQLLAANLATGFCQSAMTYSTLPSSSKIKRIIKATYQEPFLVVAHSEGALLWSVMEEFCCAALPSTSNITSIAISRDFDNWGLLVVGSKNGHINCYSLH